MAKLLNPETESITLNTEFETPTLDPATELEALTSPLLGIARPSPESTSNLSTSNIDNSEVVDASPLDADAPTEPVAQAATLEQPASSEAPAAPAAVVEAPAPVVNTPAPVVETPAPFAPAPAVATHAAAPAATVATRAATTSEPADDFSEALAAFEREQAAEAAAVEAYGDKIVSGTVLKQTEKHLVLAAGLSIAKRNVGLPWIIGR